MIDLWMGGPGRWRGRAFRASLRVMDWRVGVLWADAENVVWTHGGAEPDWVAARAAALRHLRALAGREGRQEYRIQVGDVDGIVTPGVDEHGSIDLNALGESLPLYRY